MSPIEEFLNLDSFFSYPTQDIKNLTAVSKLSKLLRNFRDSA